MRRCISIAVLLLARFAAAQEDGGTARVAAVAVQVKAAVADEPISYTYSTAQDERYVELWVFAGLEAGVSEALRACRTSRERLIERLNDKSASTGRVDVLNQFQVGSPYVYSNYYVGFCPFSGDGEAWEYDPNLSSLGITGIDVSDDDDATVRTGADEKLLRWLTSGSDVFSLPASQLFERKQNGRWAVSSLGSIRFHVGQDTLAGAVSRHLGAFFKAGTQWYFHFSLEPLNSYGINFANGGKFVAIPLTAAIGADFLPFDRSSWFFGFRAIIAPSVAFSGSTPTELIELSAGGRLDFDGWVGIGAGAIYNFAARSFNGLFLVSIGPNLLRFLTTR